MLFFSLVMFYLFSACNRCEDPESDTTLYVRIFENNYNVFDELFPLYSIDTFRLLDQNHELLNERSFYRASGGFIIHMPKKDLQNGGPNQEMCKKYFLYFHKDDTDTMDVCYTAKFNSCGEPSFNYVNIKYNDVLKFEGGGGNFVPADVDKYP